MKLISMTEFVLELEKTNNHPTVKGDWKKYILCCEYAKFLSQPLKLWMLVPCGEDGEPLNEPKTHSQEYPLIVAELDQYQKAKERVLFEGFEYKEGFIGTGVFIIELDGVTIYSDNVGFVLIEKVEDLLTYNHTEITLTQTAIKQIGV